MPRYIHDYGTRYGREYRRPRNRAYYDDEEDREENRGTEHWRSRPRQPGYGRRQFGRRLESAPYDGPYIGYGVGPSRQEQGGWTGYGRQYRKSRWETDHGDPFRDRERGTPVRMTRGRWQGYGRGDYGREHFGERQPRGRGYGEEYEFRPREHRGHRLRRF